MMKYIYLAFALLIHSLLCAQEMKKLNVGDKMQRSTYDIVQNHSSSKIILPSENKKLTLLYIMSTSCIPCIKKIPYLQRYRDKDAANLEIILVFSDSLKRIEKVKKNVEILRNTTLPILPAETGLYKKFSYRTYGSTIWLDQTGTIRFQTETDEINQQTIKAFISDTELSIVQTTNYPVTKELSVKENLSLDSNNKSLFSFELFYKSKTYTSPMKTGWYQEKDSLGRIKRLYSYDTDIITVAQRVLDNRYLHKSRIIIESTNKERLVTEAKGKNRNSFAFDLNIYDNNFITASELLKLQIENLFGIEIVETIKKIRCYAIRRFADVDMSTNYHFDQRDIPREQLKTDNIRSRMTSDEVQIINNMEWSTIINDLNMGNFSRKLEYYLVDETGLDPDLKVDFSISLRGRDNNINQLNESIAQYGLVIKEVIRPLKIILIRDKKEVL